MFFSNGQNKKTIEIRADEVGLVTAKIGANLPPGERFGKNVECEDFQIEWQAQDFINERLHYYKINSNFTLILKLTQLPHDIEDE